MTSARRLIDVSHVVEDGLVTYPGLPGPVVSDYLSRHASESRYSEGMTFQIGRIEMIANTGTYIDAPFHRFEGGMDIAGLPLERIADLEGLVVDAPADRAIGTAPFEGLDLGMRAVLIRTGWDRHWRTPKYAENAPYVTRELAELLVRANPALVGIDSINIDAMEDGARPAHTLLLGAGIPVVEHLRGLDGLPASGFRFHCVPVRFRGVGTFPVRAYAIV